MAEILNIENPTVTYILEMNVKVGSTDIETWIKNTSAKYTYELNELNCPRSTRYSPASVDNALHTLQAIVDYWNHAVVSCCKTLQYNRTHHYELHCA